jgi:histidinol-phosphate aminotransferase
MASAEELDAHRNAMTLRLAACQDTEVVATDTESLASLVRPNVLKMEAYSSARDEYSGKQATVFLDANENPYNAPFNRYPDPLQTEVKAELAEQKGVRPSQIFLGNGSDEAIDLVFRVFCRPGVDNVVALEPTYGMYAVCAATNDVEYRRVLLCEDFSFSATDVLKATDATTKAIFLCSPNNPTGNLLPRAEIDILLKEFPGIVVVDEAYGDFVPEASLRFALDAHPRLIVLATFSKAWASAGLRLGIAMASEEIIGYFNKVKYPYNVNILTQQQALEILKNKDLVADWIKLTLDERERLAEALASLAGCQKVYPSDANFVLIKIDNATALYNALVDRGIIVRNRSKVTLCNDCLRITVGTPAENNALLSALKELTSSAS